MKPCADKSSPFVRTLFWFIQTIVFGAVLTVSPIIGVSQDDDNNKKPKIKGQRDVSIDAGQSYEIRLTDLDVEDEDDWWLWPWGFTLNVYDGQNFSREGNKVTPSSGFSGVLKVPVTVNDGDQDSDVYNFSITVIAPNSPPVITGQKEMTTNEDQAFDVRPKHLVITDPDDNEFTLEVSGGENYSVEGTTVTPAKDFYGTLNIPLQVSDGEAKSNQFVAQLVVHPVNDRPLITGQRQALSTTNTSNINIELSYLNVQDIDDDYPNGFTIVLLDGRNYSRSGTQVIPDINYTGILSVNVRVSDGQLESPTFVLQVTVTEGDDKPVITGQSAAVILEDEQYQLSINAVVVKDRDSDLSDLNLNINTGENYTSDGTTIIPKPDFSGNLFVPVTVSDGENISDPFNFLITVRPVNDKPLLTTTDLDSVVVAVGTLTTALVSDLQITDVDNDSLVIAEVSFDEEFFSPTDYLEFENTTSIRGVFDASSGVLALVGKASKAEYAEAIKSIKVGFSNDATENDKKRLRIHVSDGEENSNTVTRTFTFGEGSIALDIPSGFTPNGDQVNDTWSVRPLQNENLNDAIVKVYNKNGVLVFKATNLGSEWDGRFNGILLPADVYFYTVELKNQPASSTNSGTIVKGVVTILR